MSSIDRRRFLEVGALGVGYGWAAAAPRPALAQAGSGAAGAAGGNVRMSGDGLGLTPEEQARLWSTLAADGGIVRDSYSNGGAVERLENVFAELLGKERAVFMPTGTLANHLAVRALAGGDGRAIVQADSHLYNDSGDCVQTLSGITLVPLGAGRPDFTLEEVEATLDRTASGRVRTPVRVISIETPVRRHFGATFDHRELDRIAALAQREGIRLHLDGARIFLQAAYEGRDLADYAAPFDTVYVSLYKYFNAPSGAILGPPRPARRHVPHAAHVRGGPAGGVAVRDDRAPLSAGLRRPLPSGRRRLRVVDRPAHAPRSVLVRAGSEGDQPVLAAGEDGRCRRVPAPAARPGRRSGRTAGRPRSRRGQRDVEPEAGRRAGRTVRRFALDSLNGRDRSLQLSQVQVMIAFSLLS